MLFNKKLFGNIRKRKEEIERMLKGIQRALDWVDLARLVYLQQNYNMIMT
jgi:hypothetical protein